MKNNTKLNNNEQNIKKIQCENTKMTIITINTDFKSHYNTKSYE